MLRFSFLQIAYPAADMGLSTGAEAVRAEMLRGDVVQRKSPPKIVTRIK